MSKLAKSSSIAELKKQIADLTEALQRERADAINVRRRSEQERAQMANLYKAHVLRELLPAIDNLGRALKHAPKELADHDYVKGVQGVVKQFEQCLRQLGVERIKTVGESFDPSLHEAVHIEDGEGHNEIISEELQAGYIIDGEVIRHSMVKVKREKK